MTEDEFFDMIAYINWEGEQLERTRNGLPIDDGREEDAETLHRTMTRFAKNITSRRSDA